MDTIHRTADANGVKTKILASVAGYTVSFAVTHGVPIEAISHKTGITRKDLINPEARLPEGIVPKIWNLLTEAHPGRALTLEMARATPYGYFGIFAHGLEFAPTVRMAYNSTIRNRAIFSDSVRASLTETATEARMEYFHPMDALDRGATAEVGLAIAYRMLREVLGLGDFFRRIEFVHKPFGPVQAYQEFFGIDVLFEQPSNAMVIAREALDHRPPQADELLFRYVHTHLELVRERMSVTVRSPELQPVYQAIAENAASADYSASGLAKRLNTSLRSLQRQLRNHDCEVRDLLDKAREANARQLLDDPKLNISSVAFVLGYSDDRAFRRAFKRWSGSTPAQYRKAKYRVT